VCVEVVAYVRSDALDVSLGELEKKNRTLLDSATCSASRRSSPGIT
jgi:hypothetical protein